MVGRRIAGRVSAHEARSLGLEAGRTLDEDASRALVRATLAVQARRRAVRWLAARPLTRRQLATRLRRMGLDTDQIESLTDDLASIGLIDDEAFARRYAEGRLLRGGVGPRRLQADLAARGVDRVTTERVLRDVTADTDEADEAIRVACARAARPSFAALDAQTAARRLAGFLQRRGFSADACRKALREALQDHPSGGSDTL